MASASLRGLEEMIYDNKDRLTLRDANMKIQNKASPANGNTGWDNRWFD